MLAFIKKCVTQYDKNDITVSSLTHKLCPISDYITLLDFTTKAFFFFFFLIFLITKIILPNGFGVL